MKKIKTTINRIEKRFAIVKVETGGGHLIGTTYACKRIYVLGIKIYYRQHLANKWWSYNPDQSPENLLL